MKKLMIAAAALMVGVAANASTYNWEVATYACVTGNEDPIGIDSAVYFFDGANGSYSAAQMAALIASDADWATKFNNAANIGSLISLADGDNEIFKQGTINTTPGGEAGAYGKGVVNAFMVMFDADNIADATKFYVTDFGGDHDVTTAEANAYVHFTADEMLAVGDPSGWTSVAASATPEPTSGLLLLLGVAGLALRRRRA